MDKNKLSLFVIVACVFMACSACRLSGNSSDTLINAGDSGASRSFKVGGFEKIALQGSVNVKYIQGDTTEVRAEGTADFLESLDISSDGVTLLVRQKERKNRIFELNTNKSVVYVTSPDIVSVSVTGSGDFRSKKHVDTDNMIIRVKGSGDVSFADIICDTLDVRVFGSGDADMKKVKAAHTMLTVKGSGDVSVGFDGSGTVESRIFGSGDITLKGTVRAEKHSIKGSGDIHCGKFTVR